MNLQKKLFPELSPNQQISSSTQATRAVTQSNTSSGAVTTNTLPPGAGKVTYLEGGGLP